MRPDTPPGSGRPLLIAGAGGHALVVADAAEAAGFGKIVLLERPGVPAPAREGFEVLSLTLEEAAGRFAGHAFLAGVGDNAARLRLLEAAAALGLGLATVIHPRAWVSPRARLSEGTVVCAGAVVQAEAVLGTGVIVNSAASVDHHCRLEAGVHIAPGAVLGGGVRVGARSFIGIGAAVRNNVTIGADVVVGAGAAVVRDLLAPGVHVGVPARPVAT